MKKKNSTSLSKTEINPHPKRNTNKICEKHAFAPIIRNTAENSQNSFDLLFKNECMQLACRKRRSLQTAFSVESEN